MCSDREQNHLDFMADMIDRHTNPTAAYAETPEQEADELLRARLGAAHSTLYVTTVGEVKR